MTVRSTTHSFGFTSTSNFSSILLTMPVIKSEVGWPGNGLSTFAFLLRNVGSGGRSNKFLRSAAEG